MLMVAVFPEVMPQMVSRKVILIDILSLLLNTIRRRHHCTDMSLSKKGVSLSRIACRAPLNSKQLELINEYAALILSPDLTSLVSDGE